MIDHIADIDTTALESVAEGVVAGEIPMGVIFGLDEDDIHAFADVADELLAAGRVGEALSLYEGCVQLDPMDVTLLCGYATVLRDSGDPERAQQVVEIIKEVASDDPQVGRFLEATKLVGG